MIRALAALLLLAVPAWAAPAEFDRPTATAIDAAIKSALGQYPGALSAGVIFGDKVWTGSYGYADVGKKVKATSETSYRMASVTKTFTAIAVLQLVEAGKLGLDDVIQKAVPSFPKKPWPITIRQLLGHLGGIYHYRLLPSEKVTKPVTTAQALAIFEGWDLTAEPGTKFVYTSYGYNLLGAAIEGVTGKPFPDILMAKIFGPLKMKHSDVERPANADATWAKAYTLKTGKLEPAAKLELSSRYPGGGTRSTIDDLLKFARAMIDEQLLKPESHRLMRTAQATRDGLSTDYGLGIVVIPLRGHRVLMHAGAQNGTSTLLVIVPAERFAIVLATNVDGQGALLSEINLALQELVLDGGMRWRAAATADPKDRALHDGMARVLSYGLAQHAFLPADDDLRDPAQLPWSFETIGAMLLTGGVIEQAHHPKLGQPLVRVGVRMAAAIEQVFGKERLALDRAEGPLSFFEDFFFACEQLECPSEARFPPELRAKVGALAADWAKANGPAVRMLRLSGAPPDPDEVRAVLQPAFAGAKIWPDLTNELARAAVRQGLGERGPRGKTLLALGLELYPEAPALQLAYVDLDAMAGDAKAAKARLEKLVAAKRPAAEVSAAVLATHAGRLRRWGRPEAADLLNKLSAEVFGAAPAPPVPE